MVQNHAEVSSATPLNALNAVVFDSETTGLDTSKARLIQVGAIRISRGQLLYEDTFETLINPGIAIPSDSTKIHGISDDDVETAAAFPECKEAMESWIGHSIFIGYSVGFDLAILKREAQLANQDWTAPRTIDVHHIVRILAPRLPDYSLETIASWLGIETTDRHRALGDAIITGKIFLTLIPQLADRGIRSLAELETACRQVSSGHLLEAEAGWYDFLHSQSDQSSTELALARIDSYAYRHRVRDVMSTPAETINQNLTVKEVLSIMMDKEISSVFVKDSHNHYGIVTERDLLRAINKGSGQVLDQQIHPLANKPLIHILDNDFLYRAMGKMTRFNIRHLAITDSTDKIVGALTSRDLLKQRSDDALNLGDAIELAQSGQDLALIWANLALVATALDREDVDARDIAAVISTELCALTRRACEISEQTMVADGFGTPPRSYAMMVLGSGGRGESLLAMDQDNAIVYQDADSTETRSEDIDAWFKEFGTRVSGLLDSAGVPFCKGGVMAMNQEWRMSVSQWKTQIGKWITRTTPEDILKTDIFFDAVSVHGNHQLMEEIYTFAMHHASRSREFLHLLAINASDLKSPLGAFGRIRLTDKRVDLKMGGILPIFSAARVEAIRHQVSERSTPGRLHCIAEPGKYPEPLIDNLTESHAILLGSILKQQLYDLDKGIPLSNRISPDAMKPNSRNNLKWALEQVASVSDLLGVPV